MVHISAVRASNAALANSSASFVAVFAGGTAGIGESALRALAANATNPKAYLVGRNETAAKKIIEDCLKDCPGGTFEFIKADLGLLKNVDSLCEEIRRKEGHLDLLFMSQGYLTFDGRKETSEGIDVLFCLRYYGRMRMVQQLLPLLEKASAPKVVSIFSPGKEGKIYVDDLSLRDPAHFGIFSHISHVSYMTTFFMEEIASRNPSVGLVHVYPGLVKTEEFQKGLFPAWFKFFTKWIMLPLITPFAVPVKECGERSLFAGTSAMYPARKPVAAGQGTIKEVPQGLEVVVGSDGKKGSGSYSVNWNGEIVDNRKMYDKFREQELGKKVWDHTMRAFEAVEAGRKFES
jgi:NAD(P)-dependent dehydrogenase (short-subunit alcohol dehydrogenase family)